MTRQQTEQGNTLANARVKNRDYVSSTASASGTSIGDKSTTIEPRIVSLVNGMSNHLDNESAHISNIEYLVSKLGLMNSHGITADPENKPEVEENTLASTLEKQCRKQFDLNGRLYYITEHLQSLVGAD